MANRRGRRGRLTSQLGGGFVVPTLALSATSASLASTAGSTEAVQSVITATSGNGGTLGGVGIGTITESVGSGWLSASVQGGFPALVTIVCDPTGLSAGTYTGSVQVTDPKASNSPRSVSVTFTVAAVVAAAIQLSSPTVTLSVQQGNAATTTATCTATSATATALGTLSLGTITGTGSTGVTASVTGNVITVTGASAALTSASSPYTATVPVIDATASNSPQNITVTLNVAPVSPPATPTMALSSPSVSWSVTEGTSATRTTTVTVSSINAASLGTTSVGTITGTAASGVTTSVSGHVVTVTYTLGAAAPGSYTASVPILDTLADNTPLTFTVNVTVVASGVSLTNIPSAVVQFGSPAGNTLVVGGYPLPPNALTAADVTARKFAIFVNGVEQPCYVQAFPGLHPDGTSLRAVGYQFYYNIPNSTPIVAEVRLGTVRTTTDLNKAPLTGGMLFIPQTPQAWGTDAEPCAKLVPTDPAYLCLTDAAFAVLQPSTQDDPEVAARYVTFLNTQFAKIKNLTDSTRSTGSPPGYKYYQSTYESGRALIAQWCRTGNTDMLREALKQGYRLLEYTGATTSASRPNPTNNVFARPEYSSTDGSFAESSTMRFVSYAACWQLSWYVPFFAGVNSIHMHENSAFRSTASGAMTISGGQGYIEQNYIMRANVRKWVPHVMAYAIGANRRQLTASGYGNRDMIFPTELPHILAAIGNTAYTKGDYRDGFVGTYQNSTNGNTVPAGQFPNFQVEMVNAFLWLYEHTVHGDSRIPGWIKTNTSVILQNAKPLTASSRGYGYTTYGYGVPYDCTGTAGQGTAMCDYLGIIGGSIAYCAARWPNDVVNGATFAEWHSRAVDPKNNGDTPGPQSFDWGQFSRAWKVFGEMFGFQMSVPYWITHGVPAGPASIHAQSVITQWPE